MPEPPQIPATTNTAPEAEPECASGTGCSGGVAYHEGPCLAMDRCVFYLDAERIWCVTHDKPTT